MKTDLEIRNDEEEEEPLYEHYRFIADPGQQLMRIDQWLKHKIANVSRNRIQKTMEMNAVFVNGNVVRSNYRIKPKDLVQILLPFEPEEHEIIPENIPLDIKYEDDYLLVVNKPAGMVVHPGYNNYNGTLVNALVYHYGMLPQKDVDHRPGLVHRIDKDTSGLLVIGKTEEALAGLAYQFAKHTIHRRYLAICWGQPEKDEFTITGYLGRSQSDRRKVKMYKNEEHGKWAVTHVKVLEKFYFCSLVECRLETGRTHQIRVHMSSIGHPLFSDITYGGRFIAKGSALPKFKQFIENAFEILPRQALHAAELGFEHPITAQHHRFEQELPQDMATLLDKIRAYTQVKI